MKWENVDARDRIFVPNEIFEELVTADQFKSEKSEGRANHIAFAYSFYYLTCWLYRNCWHFGLDYDTKKIKKELGYHENYKGMDYIIKKNGVLDQLGYTESTTDYPIAYDYDSGYIFFYTYETISKEQKEDSMCKKMRIKKPIKAFHRTPDDKAENYENGTFFETYNTTMIPYDIFDFCMKKEDIGTKGFYLYSYIAYQSERYHGSFNKAFPDFAAAVGFSESTLTRVLKRLEAYNMITNSHNPYILDRPAGKKTLANEYSVLEWKYFREMKLEYVQRRRVMSNDEHEALIQEMNGSMAVPF